MRAVYLWGWNFLKEFIDKVQQNPTKIKLEPVTGEENTYNYSMVGTVTTDGTPLNRATMMAIQGFEAKTTKLSSDKKSIIQTNSNGDVLTITFNADGTVTQTLVGEKTITLKTSFSNGEIKEVLS